jgi:hypothetical protein
MSGFETKTADNFIFEEVAEPRPQESRKTPFLRKNVVYVQDQQAGLGAYTSGEVVIDSQSIAASGNAIDWRNAYLTVPYRIKWDVLLSATGGAVVAPNPGQAIAKFALAMKNMSLLDSLKVEANGKTVLTATQFLPHLTNFKLLSQLNATSLEKECSTLRYYPDSEGQLGDGGADNINTPNDPMAIYFAGGAGTFDDIISQYNEGLIKRQDSLLPIMNAALMDSANAKTEGLAWDTGALAFNPTTTTTQTPSDVHFLAILPLKRYADLFDKHPIARGVSYRFTLRFNQCISTLTQTGITSFAASDPTITSTVQSGGSVQPGQLCCGPNTILGRMTWTNSINATHTLTSQLDTSADARIQGVRLYCPSYELAPEAQQEIVSNPPVKREFMDFLTQVSQGTAAAGTMINVQVSTSCTNPRALIVIPRFSQVATGSGGQGFYSETSPLTGVPGCTDALMSITNMQIKMGSNYILPDRLYYTHQTFLENIETLFANDGNQTDTERQGLITKSMFECNHRYYAFDLSRYPDAMTNLPQMISFEAVNNTQKTMELLCILVYGRTAEWNFAQGSMTITA